MNKNDLIGRISKELRCSRSTAATALNATLDSITDALKKGQCVTLVGFGTFLTMNRKTRKGRDPRTRKEITIPGKRVPKFRPGKALKSAVKKKSS
jgi:DNA-binding protein HU-beta